MFKWPGTPSARPQAHELADFAELLCWQDGYTSAAAIGRVLGQLAENDYPDGVMEEEEIPGDIVDAYLEIERRVEACGGGYPFVMDAKGNALQETHDSSNESLLIYRYLLLATRLNMIKNHKHAGIDGALLFEEVSAETGRLYFGARTESLVFGTAARGIGFSAKVNGLCEMLGEGDGYIDRSGNSAQQKDGKLDVVLWKHFSDRQPGKFIAFGQCKTGTHYHDTLAALQPDAFCAKWIQSPLALKPARMFFVAETVHRDSWFNNAKDAGLLFDRCRIVDFSCGIDPAVLDKVKMWTAAAAEATDLPNHFA